MNALAVGLVTLGSVGLLHGGWGGVPSLRGSIAAAVAAVAGVLLGWREQRRGRPPLDRDGLVGAVGALFVLLLLPASRRPFSHLSTADFTATWPYFLAAGGFVAHWIRGRSESRAFGLLVVLQVALVLAHRDFTQGALPTRDDHPSFLYRFHLLAEIFPATVAYNPEWNGGYLTTEILASGVLGPFLLSLPFAWLAPLERLYGWAIPYFVIGLIPWITVAALRAAGIDRAGAALGAALALAPTTFLFLFALVYGVLPFVLSSAFAVLAAALFARLFLEQRGGALAAACLVAATSLCLLWPLGALMLAPVIPAFLASWPRLGPARRRLAAGIAAALVVVNGPWIWVLASSGKAMGFFAAQKSLVLGPGFSASAAAGALVRVVEELHPVCLVLAPIGFLLLARRNRAVGAFFAAIAAWSLLVVVVGPQVKEHVALDRFSLPFALFTVVGSAAALGWLLERPAGAWRRAAAGVAIGVILMGVANAGRFYQNRGHYGFRVMPAELERILEAVRDLCPADRRVLVPGFSLHWFGGGHMAPLPFLTGRPFVGNDFYHRRDYRDAVPADYRKPGRFEEFLDLYNVGCILTWDEPWGERLGGGPRATELRREGRYRLFATGIDSGYFLRGSGRVEARLGSLVVETDDPEVVIKFRFVDGLRTVPPVSLEPHPVYGDVSFIRLRPDGHRHVEIRR